MVGGELREYVYVVGAINTDTDRVTDVQVHRDLKRAQHVFSELKAIYGGANVFMASCEVDSVKLGAPTKLSDLMKT